MAVDGTYKIMVEGMGQAAPGSISVKTQGSAVTGTADIMGQKVELKDGKLSGDTFTGSVTAETPLGKTTFKVSGTVVGTSISGKLKAGLLSANFKGSKA